VTEDHQDAPAFSRLTTLVEWQSPTRARWANLDVCGICPCRLVKVAPDFGWSGRTAGQHASTTPSIRRSLQAFAESMLATWFTILRGALTRFVRVSVGVGQTPERPGAGGSPFSWAARTTHAAALEYRIFKRDTLRPALAESTPWRTSRSRCAISSHAARVGSHSRFE